MNQRAPILTVFGTRPEIIKLMPVLRALESDPGLRVIRLSTGQQADLAPPFLRGFGLDIDESLDLMIANQSLNALLANLISAIDQVIERHRPSAVIVQGDTTSALAGALSARFRAVPVIHIEAGLRTGDIDSPFPEESNRRLISQVSSLHLAATPGNVATLLSEGIAETNIFLTGNPVVDAIQSIATNAVPTAEFRSFLERLDGKRIVALTAHRRENFGARLDGYLRVIRDFIATHDDTVLVFPVHPNPEVQRSTSKLLGDCERVSLIEPLAYTDFFCLLKAAWLVLSDSGGIQEEVVTLGKPLLVLREQTERPEAIASGTARLARTPEELVRELETAAAPDSWCTRVTAAENPFGDGRSGARIARAISAFVEGADGGQKNGSG